MSQVRTQEKSLTSLVKVLFSRQIACYLAIFGRRGTGKTDLSLLIAEILAYNRIIKHFSTNIKIYKSKFHIEPVFDLFTLKQWCKDTKGRKLFILDEIGRTVSRRTPMARLNVKVINELQILRKYKLSMIIITVDPKYTDNAVIGHDLLDGVFVKPNYQNPKLALYDDRLQKNLRSKLWAIPKTQIDFDTWDSAPFTLQPPKRKPRFKDEDKSKVWDWATGKTYKEIGIHSEELTRLKRKILLELLSEPLHSTQA